MKTIGNGNNVSYGVNSTSFSFQEYINSVLIKVGVLNFGYIVEYKELPGVENRGQKWYYLAILVGGLPGVSGKWYGALVDRETSCQGVANGGKYFMYREDKKAVVSFTRCDLKDLDLIDVLEDSQNFNPPFTRSETRDWISKHGSLFCFGKKITCPKLE